jgi:phosphoribosylaminoimidazole-succinocarboxamide synthase
MASTVIDAAALQAQLTRTLRETGFDGLGTLYRGKVRDVYTQGDRVLMVATDRLSAFDQILGTIPFKGELLTRIAAFWFEKTRDVCASHLLDVPDPNVMVGRRTHPLPVEVVVRGYLTGSLWRDLQAGKESVYGIAIPREMRKDAPFAEPIITPSTKEAYGKHDEPLSSAEVVRRGLVEAPVWADVCAKATELFRRGQQWAQAQGLILVDTKYEFGLAGSELLVIDEIHTMDSSRYWDAGEYAERFAAGADQLMLDKENIRQWLIREHGFSGQGTPPPLTDAIRVQLASQYASAFARITGTPFASEVGDPLPRLEANLRQHRYLP